MFELENQNKQNKQNKNKQTNRNPPKKKMSQENINDQEMIEALEDLQQGDERELPLWMITSGQLLIRCGKCHYYKQDVKYRQTFNTSKNKTATHHVCPFTKCPGYAHCQYERGHIKELRAKRQAKKDGEKKIRVEIKRKEKDKKNAKAEKKKQTKEAKAKEKLERQNRVRVGECTELTTYLHKLGVKKRYVNHKKIKNKK